MKKKAISACIGTLAMSMVLVSGVTTSAKVAASEQNMCISTEQNSDTVKKEKCVMNIVKKIMVIGMAYI